MTDSEYVGWFDALGSPVPEEQREAALREAERMSLEDPDPDWVNRVAAFVETDRPAHAIDAAREELDLTGAYRFLAALCTPVPDDSADNSGVDGYEYDYDPMERYRLAVRVADVHHAVGRALQDANRFQKNGHEHIREDVLDDLEDVRTLADDALERSQSEDGE